jgi:hypothetical protein
MVVSRSSETQPAKCGPYRGSAVQRVQHRDEGDGCGAAGKRVEAKAWRQGGAVVSELQRRFELALVELGKARRAN